MEYNNIEDEISEDSLLCLVGALFRLCAQDYKYGRKQEVEDFIESDWFIQICDSVNFNSEQVRKHIRAGRTKQRIEYQGG